MRKKFLTVFSLIFMLTFMLTVFSPAIQTGAATGSSLFTVTSGTATIDSTINGKGGALVTIPKTGKRSTLKYTHTLDSTDISVFVEFPAFYCNKFTLRFADNYNSTKYLEISLEVRSEGGFTAYAMDNYETKSPELKFDNPLSEAKFELGYRVSSESEKGGELYISINAGTEQFFDVSGLRMRAADTSSTLKQLSFDNDDVMLFFSLADQLSTEDTKMLVTGIKMFGKIQLLDDQAEGYVKQVPVLKRRQGLAANEVIYIFKGTLNKTYTFPIYIVSVLGDKVYTSVVSPSIGGLDDPDIIPMLPETWNSPIYNKTSHTLDSKGWYIFKVSISNEVDADSIYLKIFVGDATVAPTFNTAKVVEKVAEMLPNRVLIAPALSNTFEFPSLRSEEFVNILGGIDALYNIKIQLGYRKPGTSTGTWTYCEANEVQLNAVGTWAFTYRVVDSAGNESALGEIFTYIVNDVDAPKIEATRDIEVVVNTEYTIASPTISDNASGVDSSKTVIKLYTKDGEEIELKDNKFRPSKLTPNGDSYSYYITYQAVDNYGNATEELTLSYVKIVPYSGDPVENPANVIIQVVLIVVASIAGIGLVVLTFTSVKPRKKED